MRRRYLLTSIVFITVFTIAILLLTRGSETGTGVKASEASTGTVVSYLSTSGMVESRYRREYFVLSASKVRKVFVKVFDSVKKGEVLAELDWEDLSLQIEGAERQYENAKLLLEKMKSQRQTALYEGMKAVPAASIPGSLVTYNDIKMQENAIEIAKINLETLKNRASKQQKAIIADRDGVVSMLNVSEGGVAGPQLPAVVVEDTSDLQIVLNVNQFDIASIEPGQEVIVTINNKSFEGRVEKISPVAVKSISTSGAENLSKVIIGLLKKGENLNPGFEVDVKIKTGEKSNVVKIPAEAVLRDKTKTESVFVIENNIITKRKITTGLSSDNEVEVLKGLRPGERVVLNPLPGMQDGEKVKVEE